MKKIGICTCYNTLNYGSMLQSYATQYVIDQLGYDSEFIIYKKKKNFKYYIMSLPRVFDQTLMSDKFQQLQKKVNLAIRPQVKKDNDVRFQAFMNFQKLYYKKFSQEFYGYKALCEGAHKYDAFVVGSDQLWLPGGLSTNFYNLMFVPDEIKKISYATSFGVSTIPKRQYKKTKQYLIRINNLSVREESGAKIIKNISGRTAKVVADPTILLSKADWDRVIPYKQLINEPYVFCYFLGINKSHRKIARDFANQVGLKIVSTPFLDNFIKIDQSFGDISLFDIGPDDFLNLIRDASYVLTDSFHGTVFSIINHKQFVTFNRFNDNSKNSRNSRIDSLCNLIGIKDRIYKQNIFDTVTNPIDYSQIDIKLDDLRASSIEFLKAALNK